jgi:hypothetical protein
MRADSTTCPRRDTAKGLAMLRQSTRRSILAGITLALTGSPTHAADNFDYVNAEYPPVAAVDGQCPDGYAWDFQRGDRCVSLIGWCEGELWTCAGRPERHAHPQFVCKTENRRKPRCCRSWWPPAEGVTPEWAKGDGRCWQYKPARLVLP